MLTKIQFRYTTNELVELGGRFNRLISLNTDSSNYIYGLRDGSVVEFDSEEYTSEDIETNQVRPLVITGTPLREIYSFSLKDATKANDMEDNYGSISGFQGR